MGTAGGVRACASFFGDEPFLVISGDALTDIDLGRWRRVIASRAGSPRWRSRRSRTRASTGSCCTTATGGSPAFRRSPPPRRRCRTSATAGSTCSTREIFDYFPPRPFVDWAQDVFPVLLENDVPFHIHETREYWNDVGSLSELKQGTFDALDGRAAPGGRWARDQPRRDRRRGSSGAGAPARRGRRDRRGGVDRTRRQDRQGRAPDGPGRARRRRHRRRARAAAREHRVPRDRASPPSRS